MPALIDDVAAVVELDEVCVLTVDSPLNDEVCSSATNLGGGLRMVWELALCSCAVGGVS